MAAKWAGGENGGHHGVAHLAYVASLKRHRTNVAAILWRSANYYNKLNSVTDMNNMTASPARRGVKTDEVRRKKKKRRSGTSSARGA